MRICFFAADNSWHMPIWVKYFVERKHDVHLITIKAPEDTPRVELPGVKIHYLPPKISKIRYIGSLLAFPTRIISLRRMIKNIRPDIVNAVDMEFGIWGALSGVHPFVMTPHGSDVIVLPKKSKIAKWKNRFIFKFADVVTGDSEVCLNAAIEGGAPAYNAYIVQWGVDFDKFNINIDGSLIRRRYDLTGLPVIFSPRGFSEIYNIDTIIRSIPLVLERLPNAKFLFCYHFTQQEKYLKRLVTDLGVTQSVIFVGFVSEDEMPYYMAASDICVSVSSSDSSPRSVYEAMACGVPVILSDLPWWKGMLTPKKNALIVPIKDHEALAQAIIKLYNDRDLRKEITEENFRFVSEMLDSQKHREKLESIFDSLVQSRRRV